MIYRLKIIACTIILLTHYSFYAHGSLTDYTSPEKSLYKSNPRLMQCLKNNNHSAENLEHYNCDDGDIMITGWCELEPYQFIKYLPYSEELSGLDIDIIKVVAKSAGIALEFHGKSSCKQLYEDIEIGARDIATGAIFDDTKSEYAYFSDSYRNKEDSLFVLVDSSKSISFNNIKEFIAEARSLDFKIGVSAAVVQGNASLENFIKDPSNKDIVINIVNPMDFLKKIMNGEIDGFIVDKLVGSSIVLKNKLGSVIKEIPMGVSTPMSFILSKQTTNPEILGKINKAIADMKKNGTLERIKSDYFFKSMLLEAIKSSWLNYVTLIGVIAFALSGVALGAKDNMSLFSAVVIGILPSIPASYIRDFIINDTSNSLQYSTIYIMTSCAVGIFGISITRLFDIYNCDPVNAKILQIYWEKFFTLTDVVGKSCFIITGATYAALNEFRPLEIWGPICAFLVSDLGTIARDLLTKKKHITSFNGSLNPEISILWGLIFSIFIKIHSNTSSLFNISVVVTIIVVGAIISRILLIKYKISNFRFQS